MKKIVITGPECTGKSTLCAGLAAHYKTVWCPEFAREYLLKKEGPYDESDLLNIAKGQVELEDRIQKKASGDFYFIDTDMYVMKVWSEVVFGNCDPWILKQIVERHYDFYLLCDVGLPWVQDGLREYPQPEMRQTLFLMYKDILVNQRAPWSIVTGLHNERLQSAVSFLNNGITRQL